MELPPNVIDAITLASCRAKTAFNTYGWKWLTGIPTISEIQEKYLLLATFAKETGNAMSGRLTVEYVDEHWEFGLLLTDAWDYSE